MEREINRTNRLFAVRDPTYGNVYKVKPDGARAKLASCPEHCFVDNNLELSMDMIDKDWYIALAKQRINEFLHNDKKKKKEKKMEDLENVEVVATKEEPATKGKSKSVKLTFREKWLNLCMDMSSEKLELDGYNVNQKYSYSKASNYKQALQRNCIKNGLIFHVTDVSNELDTAFKSDKMNLTKYVGQIIVSDVSSTDDKDKFVWTIMANGSDTGDKGPSKAKTMAIKDWCKGNFLLSDGDDADDSELTGQPAETKPKNIPATPEAKEVAMTKVLKEQSPKITKETSTEIEKAIERIRQEMNDPAYGASTISSLNELSQTDATIVYNKLQLKADSIGLTL